MINFLRSIVLAFIFIGFALNGFGQKQTYNFEKVFKTIDSLALNAKPKEALALIESLNKRIRESGNTQELVQITAYKIMFQSYLNEEEIDVLLADFKADIKQAPQPAKSILQSMLAEMYWKYYNNNFYKIYNRTAILNDASTDIKTWSARRFAIEIINTYKESLSNLKILQSTKVDELSKILIKEEDSRYLRPTLYDLLAHRALNVLNNSMSSISVAQNDDAINFNNPIWYADYKTFLKQKISPQDSSSFSSTAVFIYQNLIQFHQDNQNIAALGDVDFRRLKYFNNRNKESTNSQIYINALQDIANYEKDPNVLGDVLMEQLNTVYSTRNSKDINYVQLVDKATEIQKIAPKSIAFNNAQSLIDDIKKKYLNAEIKAINTAEKPLQILYSYKNLDSVYVKLYRVNLDFNGIYNKKDYTDFIGKRKVLKEWKVILPKANDYKNHSMLDKIEGLGIGNYFLIFQSSNATEKYDELYNSVKFSISNLVLVNRMAKGGSHQEYYLLNGNGEAKKNVEIKEQKRNGSKGYYITEENITTDENGYAKGISSVTVNRALAIQGRDSVYTNFNNYNYGKINDGKKVLFFTDRPIYRPGQTVYFKGVLLKVESYINQILPKENVSVDFKDTNDKVITEGNFMTNDFGTFQGSFTIPMGKLNGQMRIYSPNGSISIQVEEYKRPSFEVVFDPLNQKYKLNDSVKVKGKAMAYAGYTIGNAKITYKVNRTVFNWAYYRNYSNAKQIAIGTAQTKEDGSFEINFFAEDDKSNVNFSYEIIANITDVNGETRTKTTQVNVGKKDIQLMAQLPPYLMLSNEVDSIPFNVLNLNGQAIQADVQAEWYKLETPGKLLIPNGFSKKPEHYSMSKADFQQWFPNEEYDGELDFKNWPLTKLNFNQTTAIKMGSGEVLVNPKFIQDGYYKLVLTAKNEFSDTVKIEQVIKVYNQQLKNIQSTSDWLLPEKINIKKNEEAIFKVAGFNTNSRIYYEVLYKDSIIERKWLQVSTHQTLLKIKPDLKWEEQFAVQFFMVHDGKVYPSMQQVTITDPSKMLDVEFLTFRNKLQPGEKESWKLSIKSKTGEKQMAELLATMYDASLDDLKKMSWNKISDNSFYYNIFNWNFKSNAPIMSNEFWFLNRNKYYTLDYRKYDRLDDYYFNAYSNYNRASAYNDYLAKLQNENKKANLEKAIKNLEALKGSSLVFGVITDRNGFGIPGVQILSGKLNATSNTMGIYTIDAKEGDKIEVKYIGYQSSITYVGKNKRLDIILEYDGQSLNEVSVVGAGSPGSSKNIMLRGISSSNVAYSATVVPALEIKAADAEVTEDKNVYDFVSINYYDEKTGLMVVNGKPVNLPRKVETRKNFLETAFFYPQLRTDENGEIKIDFTIPQSLTRYKMMGLVHTKDLKSTVVTKTVITQKQLAISANVPRFFRVGDTILLSAKLNNLSGKLLKGSATLILKDALTDKEILIFDKNTNAVQAFELNDKANGALTWAITIPNGIDAITYKVIAQSGSFSDGEENTIPVLPNAMLLTETMPISVKANTSKTFVMDNLLKSGASKTLRNQSLTFEFTANPVWYAVQALPYLMEYPYDCAEQTFSRFFANSFATGIINSSPKIKQVFDQWNSSSKGESLLSNLEKNQELKSILLQETPWVKQANNETEQKKRLALLFDLNRMRYELKANFEKLESMQASNGAFPWFAGMRSDRYITQHIVLGMGQLKHAKLINEKEFPNYNGVLSKAIAYLDKEFKSDFEKAQKSKSDEIGYLPLHYLYARSYSKYVNKDTVFGAAFNFYIQKLTSNWKLLTPYQQAQAALVLKRNGQKEEALKIINLLKQRAKQSDEMGMYWANNINGWWWYQNNIETQAVIIEAFDEVAQDEKSVEEMKVWLLKNKQTNDWKSTKATAAACYALLMRGYNLLADNKEPEILIGNKPISTLVNNKVSTEAGSGYQKITLKANEITSEMAKVEVKNSNNTVAWGALYWQYFEQLDKIKATETGLKIKKQLFLSTQTSQGNVLTALTEKNVLKPGDLVMVRIEIVTDRAMEYLHLKDMRSSGLEPVNVISQYKYQGGLGYYESTKDASTNFFINYLNKGTYVFEYSLRVNIAGSFSNGITSLQSMYAPEFSTYSEGIRLKISQ